MSVKIMEVILMMRVLFLAMIKAGVNRYVLIQMAVIIVIAMWDTY